MAISIRKSLLAAIRQYANALTEYPITDERWNKPRTEV